jgi:hypothetical protein
MATSYPNFRDYREQAENVFSGTAATVFAPLSLTKRRTPEQVFGEMVTGNYFDVLGVRAAVGQTFSFTAAKTSSWARIRWVVLSDGLWKATLRRESFHRRQRHRAHRQRYTVLAWPRPGFARA